jgi:tetratricopeptide (TPR) repeat protein
MRLIFASAVCATILLVGTHAQIPMHLPNEPGPIAAGKRALAAKDFAGAKGIFARYLEANPGDPQAELGLADAQLGLHEYEAAEAGYRRIVARQPLFWDAHKNLVIVEAALGRWEDFDGERTVLHAARERHAAGISPRDSDVIDVITVGGQRWIVRDYFEPAGRSQTRYNFERFSPEGRVLAYVSLESADAFRKDTGPAQKSAKISGLALNWYNGKSHGTIARYATEPKYERARADFLKWLRTHSPNEPAHKQ